MYRSSKQKKKNILKNRMIVLKREEDLLLRENKEKTFLSHLGGIPVGEKIAIYFFEFFNAKVPAWTILEKSFVPFLYLGVCNYYTHLLASNEKKKLKSFFQSFNHSFFSSHFKRVCAVLRFIFFPPMN